LLLVFKYTTSNEYLRFIHIPKNAGTTIEDLGEKHGLKWGRYGEKKASNVRCNHWHVPARYSKQNYNEDTFCVVRDPYERILSEYKYVHRKDYKKWDNKEDLNKWIQKQLSKKPNFSHDCHLLPQTDYIFDENGEQVCTHILNIKNLKNEFNSLMKYHHPSVVMNNEKQNTTDMFKNIHKNDLSKKTKEMIHDYYKDDFKLL
jgi:hypothetical protein